MLLHHHKWELFHLILARGEGEMKILGAFFFFFFFLTNKVWHGIIEGSECERIVKKCVNGWRCKERHRRDMAPQPGMAWCRKNRHFLQASVRKQICRCLSFFPKTSRCSKDLSHTSLCLLGVCVTVGQSPSHIHFCSLCHCPKELLLWSLDTCEKKLYRVGVFTVRTYMLWLCFNCFSPSSRPGRLGTIRGL